MKKEDTDAVDILGRVIIKYINKALKERVVSDITYESVIKNITPKGYVVLDRSGQERIAQCCIPGVALKMLQRVWVKEPMGNLNKIHICGVVGNTSNPNRRNRSR
ncbi:MAG: hypothetical protein HFI45_06480 [Lachnospiraceae bacterium]|nr:hypothetical protein [Lachnospiraceae bacterium]